MEEKIILGLHLNKEQHRGLKVEAAKQEITMNEALRKLIDLFISRKIVFNNSLKILPVPRNEEEGHNYTPKEKELLRKIRNDRGD